MTFAIKAKVTDLLAETFAFNAQNKDSLSLSGTIPLAAGFVLRGRTLDIRIADYVAPQLTFNAKGSASAGKNISFKTYD